MRNPAVSMRLLAASLSLLGALQVTPATAQTDSACHPVVTRSEPNYVIGYGSLMLTASKDATWRGTGPNLPVVVTGFERSWTARDAGPGFRTTYLGIRRVAGARIAASLFRVLNPSAFDAGDRRESIYCRAAIDPGQVRMLDGTDTPTRGKIWIYVLKPGSAAPVSARFPIIQTYVDLFLGGCLELKRLVVDRERDFLADCIATTKGWSIHWVNDRPHPRRPSNGAVVRRIDAALQRLLPREFDAIRTE